MSLVAYQSSSDESEDEKEEQVSPSSKGPSNSVAPAQPKSREPVKIAVPSLHEFDTEFEEPSKKPKIKAASGLLSLLPAPKNTSRLSILVPPSVKKKEAAGKKLSNVFSTSNLSETIKESGGTFKSKILPHKSAVKILEPSDDSKAESDDFLPSDFFSLSSKSVEPEVEVSRISVPPTEFSALDNTLSLSAGSGRNEPSVLKNSVSGNSDSEGLQTCVSPGSSEATCTTSFVHSVYSQEHEEKNDYVQPLPSSANNMHEISSSSASNAAQFMDASSEEGFSDSIPVDMMNDERFLRLQGKRRREFEGIDIIDVKVDSQLPDKTQWYTKGITEEKKVSFSRKKGELPTQQQRRKHQITYLAFQAKERELDLKNQWAQNRLTKRETQSKYGF